ncbi:ketol-acid reductoisomerase, partial [Xanthomonas perforans]
QADLEHPIEEVGKKLRAKMVWLNGQQQAAAAPANQQAA